MKKPKGSTPKFRVGDWVSYPYAMGGRTTARIIEDRGPLGVGGRRIYRLRLELPMTDPMEFELSENFLEPATGPEE